MLQSHHFLSHFSSLPLLPPSFRKPPLRPCQSSHFFRCALAGRKAVFRAAALPPSLAEVASALQEAVETEGPIELPPSSPSSLFAVDDNPSPLQVATSVLLTGAITVFLFRSLRRRAKRAKEMRVRSTGLKKTKDVKEEALDRLKAIGVAPVEAGAPPSAAQAFLGSIAAGVIAVILYKFTTTIEASLNRQPISDNFSARQITVTIRTIINGLCYLATFVFGINSIGLFLYSIQLALSSFTGNPAVDSAPGKKEGDGGNVMDSTLSSTGTVESKSNDMQESSNDS